MKSSTERVLRIYFRFYGVVLNTITFGGICYNIEERYFSVHINLIQ